MKPKKPHGPPREVGQHLVVDPCVCHGQLTFKGTRLPVETILFALSQGRSFKSIVESWPSITPAAIAEAVNLASEALVRGSGARTGGPDEQSARLGRAT